MKSGHEVLVETRNSVEHDGYNFMVYGVWKDAVCDTPRCVLGWCGWHAGFRGFGAQLLGEEAADLPAAYSEALIALRETAPIEPDMDEHPSQGLAAEVECVAVTIGRKRIAAWLDTAITATAPTPDLSFLEQQETARA